MKLAKWSVLLVAAVSMVLMGAHTVFAGCSVGQGEDLLNIVDGDGTLGKLKGTVAVHYEVVPGNPIGCTGGAVNLSVFARLKLITTESGVDDKSPNMAFSVYFPYATKIGETGDDPPLDIIKGICFFGLGTQQELLMEWVRNEIVPFFYDAYLGLDLDPSTIKVELNKIKNDVVTELAPQGLPQDIPTTIFNVVISIDPI